VCVCVCVCTCVCVRVHMYVRITYMCVLVPNTRTCGAGKALFRAALLSFISHGHINLGLS